MSGFLFDKTANAIITVYGKGVTPTDEEWQKYLQFVAAHVAGGGKALGLNWSEGGAPSAKQRNQITERMKLHASSKVAVITTSMAVRGVVTAVSWFVNGARAFGPDEVDEAMAFIGLSTSEAQLARHRLESLRRQLT